MIHAATGEAQARRDIGGLEIRQLLNDLRRRHPGGQEIEHIDDADAHAADARTSSALLRIDGDTSHEFDGSAHFGRPRCQQKHNDTNTLPCL